LVDEGVIDPSRTRLAIAARKEDARRLTSAIAEGGKGLSKRQAAKVLGVDEKQIRRDLRTKAAESADKGRTEKPTLSIVPPRETFETIVVDPPWPMTKIERDVRPAAKCGKTAAKCGASRLFARIFP
jgi:hypothetical protein